MSQFLIYAMFDPRDGQLRYVGKSCSGMKRPNSELRRSAKGQERGHKANWLKQLASFDLKPCIVELQTVSHPDQLVKAERYWIAYFRDMNCPLTNLTDGGEGAWGRVNTIDTRLKMSRSARLKRYGKTEEIDRVGIAKDYLSGLSMRKVAELHNTSSSVVCRTLRSLSIPFRTKSQARLGVK